MSDAAVGVYFLGLVMGGLLVILAVHFLVLPSQAKLHGQLADLMERDRQEAKAEAKVFRSLVLPGLAKLENAASNLGPATAPTALKASRPDPGANVVNPSPSPLGNPLLNRRVPWRIRFKQAVKDNNDPQKHTDALAAALRNQKVPKSEEKQNV